MSLLGGTDLLYEEHRTGDDELVIYRCSECGQLDLSLGSIHGHIEGHRGYTRFGIQLPFTSTSMGDYDRLMELTEILRIDEMTEISIEEVDSL